MRRDSPPPDARVAQPTWLTRHPTPAPRRRIRIRQREAKGSAAWGQRRRSMKRKRGVSERDTARNLTRAQVPTGRERREPERRSSDPGCRGHDGRLVRLTEEAIVAGLHALGVRATARVGRHATDRAARPGGCARSSGRDGLLVRHGSPLEVLRDGWMQGETTMGASGGTVRRPSPTDAHR